MKKSFILYLILLLTLCSAHAFDETQLNKQAFVNDLANIIDPTTQQQLEQFLINLEKNTTIEFAVVTTENLDGDTKEEAALKAAEYLGVGKQDVDNGLLLFIALRDREWRIEVGYGLEGAIPDAIANRVGQNVLVPALQNEQYGQGVYDTMIVLAAYAIEDETTLSQYHARYDQGNLSPEAKLIANIIIFIIILVIFLGGRSGFLPFIFIGGGGGHGRSGGFSSGGFGGFGGGGFGGGGAGGGW